MKPVVTVVDYGMGNLLSVLRALEHCGAQVKVEGAPAAVAEADYLVLPGVGAFGIGMAELRQRGLIEALQRYAASGRPLLGICLGMQMLLDGSDEFGASDGLGLIRGWARKLPSQIGIKLPHVGWSALRTPVDGMWNQTILAGVPMNQDMYFVHSFYAELQTAEDCLAQTQYGDFLFCSMMQSGSIIGCQFHPEKSGEVGLHLLHNFLDRDRR